MSKFNNQPSLKNTKAAVALLAVSALTAAGCGGYNTSSKDSGSKAVSECPDGHIETEDLKPANPKSLDKSILAATVQVKRHLPTTRSLGQKVAFTALPAYVKSGPDKERVESEEKVLDAGQGVLHIENNGGGASSIFVTEGPETRLDDPNEQLCSADGKTYPSPRTTEAARRMRVAGVDSDQLQRLVNR